MTALSPRRAGSKTHTSEEKADAVVSDSLRCAFKLMIEKDAVCSDR